MAVKTFFEGSLHSVLEKIDYQYSTLFSSKGGFLYFNGRQWLINKKPIPSGSRGCEAYSQMMTEIVKSGLEDIPRPEDFIMVMNSKWMKCLEKMSPEPEEGNSEILFNSKKQHYQWLSNFFTTLIFDPSVSRVYSSVEQAYQSKKFRALSAAGGGDAVDSTPGSGLQASDLVKLKKAGRKLIDTEERTFDKVEVMRSLIRLKFTQNRELAQLLVNSHPYPLKEATSDQFWGGEGNHLGIILMEMRANLIG